jgi:hypothetical protein
MKQQSIGSNSAVEMNAPVVVIPGLLTGEECVSFYSHLIAQGNHGDLPAREMHLEIPDRGLGEHEDMLAKLDSRLDYLFQALGGQRSVIVGHSLGALMAKELARRNPEKTAATLFIAGAHEGVDKRTIGNQVLRRVLGNPKGYELLLADSDFMKDSKEAVTQQWDPTVPVHIVSASYDQLMPLPQGLNMQLPEDQTTNTYITAKNPLMHGLIKGIPKSTRRLGNILSEHCSVAAVPAVTRLARDISFTAGMENRLPDEVEYSKKVGHLALVA